MLEFDTPSAVLAFGLPQGGEWIIILIIGLLIFGRRLPDVGRSIGKSIVEFKRGIKGINEEIESESSRSDASPADAPSQLTDDTVARSETSVTEDAKASES